LTIGRGVRYGRQVTLPTWKANRMPSSAHDPIDLGPITVTFSVVAEESNGTVTVQRCDVAAGAGVPFAHSHDTFEETIYGLEGVTTWTIDGEEVPIGPGDTVCIPRGAVHSFMVYDHDAAFLAIATPGVFGRDYFLELQDVVRAAAGGPPNPADVAAVMLRHGLTPATQAVGQR
jgi:quercetin dioxygenase-like cupin family protein